MRFLNLKSIMGVGPLGLTLLCLMSAPVLACPEHEKLSVGHPVLAAATTATRPTAIFFTITNGQKTPDTLLGVATPMCGRAELHDHIRDGDILRMRQVKNIVVPAGASVTLKPGGLHIMCFDPVLPQNVGQNFPLVLTFEKAGQLKAAGKIVTFAEALTAGKADTHGLDGASPTMDHRHHMDHVAKDPVETKTPAAK